jgi:hypothetical protein
LIYLFSYSNNLRSDIPELQRKKIGPKTNDSIFIGYAENSAAYRFLLTKTNTIVESANAEFFEHIYPMKRLNLVNERLIVLSKRHLGMDTTQELRRSKRSRTETGFGLDFITAFLSEDDPKTYQEAMN